MTDACLHRPLLPFGYPGGHLGTLVVIWVPWWSFGYPGGHLGTLVAIWVHWWPFGYPGSHLGTLVAIWVPLWPSGDPGGHLSTRTLPLLPPAMNHQLVSVIVIVIANSKFPESYSKANRRASAYSRAQRRVRWVVHRSVGLVTELRQIIYYSFDSYFSV